MNLEEVGLFITEKRKEKGYTQKDLAEKLGVSDRAVSKWERGICLMDISLLIPLSDILGVTVNEILAGKSINKKDTELVNETTVKGIECYDKKEKNKRKKYLIILGSLYALVLIPCFIVMLIYWVRVPFFGKNGYRQIKIAHRFYDALENKDVDILKEMLSHPQVPKEEYNRWQWGADLNYTVEDFINGLNDLYAKGLEFTSLKYVGHDGLLKSIHFNYEICYELGEATGCINIYFDPIDSLKTYFHAYDVSNINSDNKDNNYFLAEMIEKTFCPLSYKISNESSSPGIEVKFGYYNKNEEKG